MVRECRLLLGVISSLMETGRQLRLAVRQAHAASQSSSATCIQFVLGNRSLPRGRSKQRAQAAASEPDLAWLDADDRNCAEKSYAWFFYAARWAPPGVLWVGKADDDSFVRTDALLADLAPLERTRWVVAGHFNWAASWLLEGGVERRVELLLAQQQPSASDAGQPCGPVEAFRGKAMRPLRRLPPECAGVGAQRDPLSGPYLFAAGPLYVLGVDLVRLVFAESPRVAALAREQRWSCRGEDTIVGYCVHLAAAAARATLALAHLSWYSDLRLKPSDAPDLSVNLLLTFGADATRDRTKFHNFAPSKLSYDGGPPSDESIVVHRLKCGFTPLAVWRLLAERTRGRRGARWLFVEIAVCPI